jgi:hypothetical protein
MSAIVVVVPCVPCMVDGGPLPGWAVVVVLLTIVVSIVCLTAALVIALRRG